MNYQDENEDIHYLINDFIDKVEKKSSLILYDIDEWLDIADFFSIETHNDFYLSKAIKLALKQYPNNVELVVRNADLIAITDYKEALEYLLESKKQFKSTEQLTLLAYQGGKILASQGKHKEAINTAKECLKHKENEYILNLIAHQYIKLSQYEEAEKYLLRAFEICFNNYIQNKEDELRSYGARDFLYAGTVIDNGLLVSTVELCKNKEEYKEKFYPIIEKFIEYDPQNTYYWELLAEFYERCEDYPKALSACEYYLCLKPDDIDVVRRKYLNYIDSGKKKERINILKKIIDLLEAKLQNKNLLPQVRQDFLNTFAVTYKEIINIYFEEEKYEQCVEICKEILEKSLSYPFFSEEMLFTKPYVYHTFSRLYLELGNYSLAESYAAKTIELDPESYTAKILYSELLYIVGKVDKAYDNFHDIYESIVENIAKIKSKQHPNEFELENHYSLLTMLITTWIKGYVTNGDFKTSLEFLDLLIEELLTVDCIENCLYTAISSYIEIVNYANSSTKKLEEYIDTAIDIYGPSLLEDLMELPAVEKNEKIRLFLENIHEEFNYDEEFD